VGWSAKFILLLGAIVGCAVAGLDGFYRGGKQHTLLGGVLGALFGAIGASLGSSLGFRLADALLHANEVLDSGHISIQVILSRTMGFAPMGAFLGAAIGAAARNPKKILQGLIGGALAGAFSGIVFDPLGQALAPALLAAKGVSSGEVGVAGRAVLALSLGAGIGLFIGLVERLSRSAWLRLSLGRNEGREWSIDSAQTFIGRSEGVQVPLFGDPNVAPIHASIQRQGPNYIIIDNNSPAGTIVNGQRIQQAILTHGANIQIGGATLVFLMKNMAAPVQGPELYGARGYPVGGYQPAPGPQAPMPGPMPGQPTQMYPQQPMPGQPTQMYPPQPMPQQPMPQQAPMGLYNSQPGAPMPAPAPMGGQPTVAYGAGMMGGFSLLAIDGPMAGQRFPVGGVVEMGREGAGIRMAQDSNASRRHAAVAPGMGGLAVTDLGSTNGTFVNGQRVSQASAGPGDLIKVGSTTFRVEAG